MSFECHPVGVLRTFQRFFVLVLERQHASSSSGELHMSNRFQKCHCRDSGARLKPALGQCFSDFKDPDSAVLGGIGDCAFMMSPQRVLTPRGSGQHSEQ